MPTTEPAAPSSTQPPQRRTRIRRWVTLETTSGGLLLAAAVIALVWANSPWRDGYSGLASLVIGPAELHLDLALATWATDGLLTVFFFVVGIELKHELVSGSLRNAREASVPVIAAVGGMAVPAVFYLVVVLALDDRTALHGWAIPTATDIAFALAVLSVFGRGLPRALRTFLLTLAVVDDLLAIVIIAVAYSSGVDLVQLGAAIATVGVFALVVRMRRAPWWVLVPIAVIAWWFMHLSGVHATIAGVLLGLSVPARAVHREAEPRTRRFDDAVRPLTSGLVLPVFAFFAAGVSLVESGGPAKVLVQPVVLAIVLGLVLGKLIGVLGVTALVTKLTPLRLPDSIGLRDLLPIGFLTGIGFTVSLLVAQLSFADGTHTDGARVAVLLGSLIAAIIAAATLRWDARKARDADMNDDGVPDLNTDVMQ